MRRSNRGGLALSVVGLFHVKSDMTGNMHQSAPMRLVSIACVPTTRPKRRGVLAPCGMGVLRGARSTAAGSAPA